MISRKHFAGTILLVLGLASANLRAACGADRIETAGDILAYGLPAVAAGITYHYKDGEGALQFGESGILTLALTQSMSLMVNEQRPNGKDHSFPSGHTAYAFFAAEFVNERYGWEAGIPAFVAASFVGYSRVEAKAHFVHDVVAGAGVGIGSSWLFTKPYKHWQVKADVGDDYVGLRLCRLW